MPTELLAFLYGILILLSIWSGHMDDHHLSGESLFRIVCLSLYNLGLLVFIIFLPLFGRRLCESTSEYLLHLMIFASVLFLCSFIRFYDVICRILTDPLFFSDLHHIKKDPLSGAVQLFFCLKSILPVPYALFLFIRAFHDLDTSVLLFHSIADLSDSKAGELVVCFWFFFVLVCIMMLIPITDMVFNISSYFYSRKRFTIQSFKYTYGMKDFTERLYQYTKYHKLTHSSLEAILKVSDVAHKHSATRRFDNLNMKIIHRFLSKEALTALLFPEYYYGEKRVSTQFELADKSEELHQLNEVIAKKKAELNQIEMLESQRIERDSFYSTESASIQSSISSAAIVRDIYHLTKTPLMSISGAIHNLEQAQNEPDEQQSNRDIIIRQTKLIEIILDGYKKLALDVPNIGDDIDVVACLNAAAESAAAAANKQVKLIAEPFPKEICDQGNRYVAILLKPLIDNAVEASPSGESVRVKVSETEDERIVSVTNLCVAVPRQRELDKQGFTTKETGGVGLQSVRMLAQKNNYRFNITAHTEIKTVVAEIRFPKK